MQRLLRLGARQAELGVLLATGLSDVAKLAERDEQEVISALDGILPAFRAARLHANARDLLGATLAAATMFTPRLQPTPIPALGAPLVASAPPGFPSVQQLFGDQSACACGHCNSVLSPAAYLVDLLRLLDKAHVGQALRQRRPDIAELELTCANTNTEVPQIDLVLEILESAVAFPTAALELTDAQRTELEQGTVPDRVRDELAKHARELRGELSVHTEAKSSIEEGTPTRLVFRNGTRRWPASLWREQLLLSFNTLPGIPVFREVTEPDIESTIQALDAGQVPASLLALIAPEPQVPVPDPPTVSLLAPGAGLPASKGYSFIVVRAVRVQLIPALPISALRLLHPDGTLIEEHTIQPGYLVQLIAAELNQGGVHEYLGQFLPGYRYEVTFDAASGLWTLTARIRAAVHYRPDNLIVDGLTYTASSEDSQAGALFADNRDPEAYKRLAAAVYPGELPFDVFTEDVRACLALAGTQRRALMRAIRPEITYSSLDDAAETLGCTRVQLSLLTETGATQARTAELWGLKETGNILVDPDGGTDPVPGDWLGALRRLSVLLGRAGATQVTLLGVLSTRYLRAVAPTPQLTPPNECRASLVTVNDLGAEHLDRLQRFLRLQRITGWPVRDADLIVDALTRGGEVTLGGEAAARAVAHVEEISKRLRVSVRRVAVWLGPFETDGYTDREAGGAPIRPSGYDEIFHNPQLDGAANGDDFRLNPAGDELAYITDLGTGEPLRRLTDRLGHLAAALQVGPAELSDLIGHGTRAVVTDELTLANLLALHRQVSLARALSLDVRDSRTLQLLAGVDLFPQPLPAMAVDEPSRRLLEFADTVEAVQVSSFTVDELAWCVGGALAHSDEEVTATGRRHDQLQWLAGLQEALHAVGRQAGPASVSEATLRVLLTTTGWPSPLQDRLLAGEGDKLGLGSTPRLSVEFDASAEPQLPAGLPFALTRVGQQRWALRVTRAVTGVDQTAAFDALAQVAGLGPLTTASTPAATLRAAWDELRQTATSLVRWLQSVELPRLSTALQFSVQAPTDSGVPRKLPDDGLGPWIRSAAAGELMEIDGYLSAAEARRLLKWAAGATNEATFRARLDPLTGPPSILGAPSYDAAALGYDGATRALFLIGYPTPADVTRFQSITDDPAFRTAVGALADASAAWVEQRPGRRVFSEQQVLDLFISAQGREERYARVHDAFVTPVRRQVAARLAAARANIDRRLFDTLDAAAALAAPAVDTLQELCSDELLGVTIRSAGAESALSDALDAVDRIDRVGLLAQRLGVQASEAAWLDTSNGFDGLRQLLSLTSATAAAPGAALAAWRRAVTLYQLRERVPGKGATLERVRVATSLTTALGAVERAFEVADGEVGELLAAGPQVTQPAQLRDPLVLQRAVNGAVALRRLPAPAASLAQLSSSVLDQPAADAARALVLAKLGNALSEGAGQGAAARAADGLRESQQRALVAYLMHRDGARDAAELHARYLLDVETGPSLRTSRIKQAMSSTQLFVQRWLLNVEDQTLPSVPESLARQWEWTKSYRVWEANRRVFLYPENWLEPGLRDDKTHLFTKLESELRQGDLTTDRAITLFENYLVDLSELAQLTVRAMYRQSAVDGTSVVHILARSPDNPPKFFYRRWVVAETSRYWSPWEPADPVNGTEHVVCFVHANRPHIAWLQVGRAVDEGSGPPGDTANWDIELLWCFRTNEGWSAPRKWRTRLRHPILLNKDERASFALRVRDSGGRPELDVYGAREMGAAPALVEPIPEAPQVNSSPRPATVWTTFHRIQVQVVGQLDTATGMKYIALDQARVEVWGHWSISYKTEGGQEVSWTTGKPAWPAETLPWAITLRDGAGEVRFQVPIDPNRVTASSARVSFRVTVAGVVRAVGPIQLDPLRNSDVRVGFRIPLPPDDPRFRPDRPVRLVHIATFGWGNSLGLTLGAGDGHELPVDVSASVHESSGFRESQPAAPFVWQGQALTSPTGLQRFFVAASAGSDGANRPALGAPVYFEEGGSAAFFLQRPDGVWAVLPASEYVSPDVLTSIGADRSVIQLGSQDTVHHRQELLAHVPAAAGVSLTHVTGDAQFELPSPYSTYDWEIFFHIPFTIATQLASQQRYADALRWLHTIFDPTAAHGQPAKAWIFKPFRDEPAGPNIDRLLEAFSAGTLDTGKADALKAQIKHWLANPFRPHGIARMRPRSYQWMVVYQYIDILIAWGDQLFKRDSIESLNEATQLYLLAAQLLGPAPRQAPEAPRLIATPTYTTLADKWDDFANAWISLADLPFFKAWLHFLKYLEEHGTVGPTDGQSGSWETLLKQLLSVGSLVFCVPANDRIETYRSTVADRLRNIRGGKNIEGVARQLALFEPPIDPELLVRAVAAGVDIDTVLAEQSTPPPRYRFASALRRALDFAGKVRDLGNALLNALEKQDGETLARMRAVDEVALLDLARATRRRELDEALANMAAIRQSRHSAVLRFHHFQRLLGKEQIVAPAEQASGSLETPRLQLAEAGKVEADVRGFGLTIEEADQLGWLTVGNTYALLGGGFQVASGIAHMIPNFSSEWFGQTVTYGGTNVGSGLGAVGRFFSMLSTNASFQATRGSIVAGHQRRYDEWVLQSNLALRELEQVDRQLLAAEIRVDLTKKALHTHDQQLADARAIETFMHSKFTREQLYIWMADRLTQAHATAFNLAYDLAKRAEAALARELGVPRPGIVRSGQWDNLHSGLLAGELLTVDCLRLDAAATDHDLRERKNPKDLPLSELDPVELLRLQTTGTCTFDVPETAFDMDYPGHYFRRIRSVKVSIPAVVGPYTSIAGTLTLLGSRTRVTSAADGYAEATDDQRFVIDQGPVQSISTSTGLNDAGTFQFDFNQDEYLPFEFYGAISRWRFELPREIRPFDYGTISEFRLHLDYTSRDGGEALTAAANDNLRGLLRQASETGSLVRTLSLRRDFPSQWHRLTDSPGEGQDIVIDTSKLPYAFRDGGLSVWKLTLYVRSSGDLVGGAAAVSLSCPQRGLAGEVTHRLLDLEETAPSNINGLARYDANLLSASDVDPVPFGSGGTESTWRLEVGPGPRYHDLVLALWCADLKT